MSTGSMKSQVGRLGPYGALGDALHAVLSAVPATTSGS